MIRLAVVLLLVLASTLANATAVIVVETACVTRTFIGCDLYETHLQRHGTVATLLATCKRALPPEPSGPGWQPMPHPDGLALRFETRIRINDLEPWMQCELLDLSDGPYGGFVYLQCLNDPTSSRMCAVRR